MKYVISLFLTLNLWAGPIRVFYEGESQFAEKIKVTLTQDYVIPEELIQLKKVSDCLRLDERGRLDLCLKNNGDLIVVSVDHEFVSESLRIFRAP